MQSVLETVDRICKKETRWPVGNVEACLLLRRAQIHIASEHPECVAPQFSNPHRDAIRILDACETLVNLT